MNAHRKLSIYPLLAAIMTLIAAGTARAAPLPDQDFETDPGAWTGIGADAKMTISHDPAHVKHGKGALQFDYSVTKAGFSLLSLPVEPGALTGMKSMRFWIMTDTTTPILVALQEKDGGRYTSTFTAPAGRWQEVWLSPSDFILSDGPTDPKDPDHKLDLDQVGQVAIADFSGFFAQFATPELISLFNLKMGPRTLYLDDFTTSGAALPPPSPSKTSIPIDLFDRPQVAWVTIGQSQVSVVNGLPLNAPSLQVTYHEAPGKLAGWYKPFHPGTLTGAARLSFPAASGVPCKLIVQVEETGGGKYNAAVDVPGGSQPKDVSVAFASFKASDDSHDDDNKLDLDQVKQVLILDATGLMGGAENDNTLWIGPVKASMPVAAGGAAKLVTGRILRLADSKPIAGATVTLSEGDDPDPLSEATTLVNGSFILRAPAGGKYRIRATDNSYTLTEKDIDTTTAAGPVQLTMETRPVLHLWLISADGKPLTDGPIEAAIRVVTATGAFGGAAAQQQLQAGAMDVTFDHAFPTDKVQSISVWVRSPAAGCAAPTLDAWPAVPVAVKLEAGSSIGGTVVDAAAKPLGQVPVFAFRMINGGAVPDLAQHAFTVTGADGKYLIPNLPKGTYGVIVKAPTADSKVSTIVVNGPSATAALVADQKHTP